jgi:four helix bundle protein
MTVGFENLEVYQAARGMRKRIYALARKLPEHERYNLVSQMRRAALSVTSNIAEGNGCHGWKHHVSFLYRSRGSAYELIDQINCCDDEEYFKPEHLADLRADIERVIQLLSGYIRHLKSRLEDATT